MNSLWAFLFVFGHQNAIAQENEFEFNSLIDTIELIRSSNPDSAYSLALIALPLANTLNPQSVALCYRNIGVIFKNKSIYDSSIYYYKRALEIFDLEQLPEESSMVLNDMGNVYKYIGDYDTSFEYYIKSTTIREELGLMNELAGSYMNIGNFLNQQSRYHEASSYYKQSLDLCIELGDSSRLSKALMNSGINETSLGNFEIAEAQLKLSLDIASNIDESRIPLIMTNIGDLNEKAGNPEIAFGYFNRATSLYRRIHDEYGEHNSIYNEGRSLRSLNRSKEALPRAEKVLAWARRIGAKEIEIRALNLTSDLLTDLGRYDESLINYKAYHILHDSLYNETRSGQIEELREKYETEKKEQQIALQEAQIDAEVAQKNGLMITLLILASLAVVVVFFYQQRQKTMVELRQKDKALYNQKVDDVLKKGEINSLNAMLEGQEKERQRIAEDLHDRLGSMLAATKLHYNAIKTSNGDDVQIKKASKILDETIEETRKIAHNLASGVLSKFGLIAALNDLKATIEGSNQISMELITSNLDNRLSNEIEITLYRVVQELISNILKHANAHNITVQLTRHDDNTLTLMVEDDGIGFNPSAIKSDGMGLSNVKARLEKLSGHVNIDSSSGNGTTTTIEIPLESYA
ncbi:MAG: sensor histidine kinase [Cyclobacteriaceae bacterium]